MSFLKRGLISAVLFFGVIICSTSGASPSGFNGVYDYSTWTSSETYGGTVVSSIDAAKQTLTLMEPDSYPTTPAAPQEFDFSHSIANSGLLSFDWSFNANVDACCSGLNFYVNGNLTNLTGGYFASPYNWTSAVETGTLSIAVNAGDTITFGAFSADSCCGATTNTISNFDVPEPATIALLGLGLAGFGFSRRKNT